MAPVFLNFWKYNGAARWIRRSYRNTVDLFLAMRAIAKMDLHKCHKGHMWSADVGHFCPECGARPEH